MQVRVVLDIIVYICIVLVWEIYTIFHGWNILVWEIYTTFHGWKIGMV